RQPGNLDPKRFKQTRQIKRRPVSLQRWVRRHDNLAHAALLDALQKLLHLELLRSDVVQRRESPMEHVIQTAVDTGPLQGQQIPRLLHHAYLRSVAPRVGTDS